MRANDKTKFLFRSLLYLGDMVLSMTSHQQALAALLDEHSSLTGLRVKTLGGADFPGGEYKFSRAFVSAKFAESYETTLMQAITSTGKRRSIS